MTFASAPLVLCECETFAKVRCDLSVSYTEYEVAASQELVTELSLRLHKTCPDPETTNQHNNALYFITPLTTFPIRS